MTAQMVAAKSDSCKLKTGLILQKCIFNLFA
jgi:hypothetical protein